MILHFTGWEDPSMEHYWDGNPQTQFTINGNPGIIEQPPGGWYPFFTAHTIDGVEPIGSPVVWNDSGKTVLFRRTIGSTPRIMGTSSPSSLLVT